MEKTLQQCRDELTVQFSRKVVALFEQFFDAKLRDREVREANRDRVKEQEQETEEY